MITRIILHILNMVFLTWSAIFMYSNLNNPDYISLLPPLTLVSILLAIVGLWDTIRYLKTHKSTQKGINK